MSAPDAAAAILWVGTTLYAVFGGADFGGGLWDLLARGRRGSQARELIGRSLTPVWEANHVWLIFCLVVLWTAFPEAFGAIMSTLYIPLCLAALGIVLRGAGFAFSRMIESPRAHLAADRVFGASSVLTPFFMGCVVGAIACGRVPADGSGDLLTSWLHPGPVAIGVLFVATCAYLSAVFLIVDAGHDDEGRGRGDATGLVTYFTVRAFAAALAAGAAAALGLVVIDAEDSYLSARLFDQALPLVILSAVAGLGAVTLLWLNLRRTRAGESGRRLHGAGVRPFAVAAVVSVIWAWGVAQYPYLLPTSLTISESAAPGPTLTAVFIVFAVAVVLILPALALLFTLAQRQTLSE